MYITLNSLLEEGREKGTVDVLKCVTSLRLNRVNLVATFSQYRFIHDCLKEMFCRPSLGQSKNEFRADYNKLLHNTDSRGITMVAHEYEDLNNNTAISSGSDTGSGDSKRFHSPVKSFSTNKNNANKDNSYKYKMTHLDSIVNVNAFVLAQTPTKKEHIPQLWHALYEQRINCIVMFGTWEEGVQYWPNDSMEEVYGTYTVKNVSVQRDSQNYLTRHFHVTCTNTPNRKPFRVWQYQFTQWPGVKSVPNLPVFMDLYEVIFNFKMESKRNAPIFIHCVDGVTR